MNVRLKGRVALGRGRVTRRGARDRPGAGALGGPRGGELLPVAARRGRGGDWPGGMAGSGSGGRAT